MRVCLKVSYDGTDYHGWQYQENQDTVEGELRLAIKKLTGEYVETIGASRTDSGVHSKGNVVVFDTHSTIPPDRFIYALNDILPKDVRILESKQVSDNFNPRFDAHNKTYEYHIDNSDIQLPTNRLYAYHYSGKLDIEKMNDAADYICGTHDFTSFSSVHTQVKSFVRTVNSCEVSKKGDEIIISINGNGFLYNMVRIIAGTLLDVGINKTSPEKIKDILEQKNRTAAGRTLPANGLILKEIKY